jgi:class 3 adenylate cyclase/tetratricopeptide (TPR) repeat protein
MKCARCENENPRGQKFCGECGARLAVTCASCGTSNPPGRKFCGECGAGLAPEVAGNAPPPSPIPRHLAEKILSSKAALAGERKQITVLFADLRGSMELVADRDPEEARKLLDPVLERMMEAVHHYEGTVNQVMGDGIMALFGAPLAHEDHAVRACYAALRMQTSIKRYTEEVQRTAGIPIQIRVGLNAGEVVVRSIGSDLHMDYTAVGQTTHLAARLEQMAMAGSILITGGTLRLVEGYVEVRPLGAVPVKGMAEPVEVYELIGTGLARTRLQAATARGLSRFVGRHAELDTLRRALENVGAGHGQVVGVVGEPGMGKSRLLWQFTRSHRLQNWLILESGAVSYGKATPYLPVIDLLKAYFQIEARDDARRIREKVTGKLVALAETLKPTLPAFLWLLDVPLEDPHWDQLDPPQRRQRTLDAVKRLLIRESQVQPLCLIIEDLHGIDAETQALLERLIESLPTARVLLLVNYRPEYEHGWGSKTFYTQLRLDPLSPETAEELLRALLGDDPGLQTLTQLLIERTERNPFFLEESVRTLVETGVLIGERGGYRLAQTFVGFPVPATVEAVLAARIDRLPPAEKRLLQTAAVIGKDVPFSILEAVAAEDELRQYLAHLQAAEFLYETRLFPDLEYTFKHALTHDVAYASLLQQRRRELHAQIVTALEQLSADRQAERLDQAERVDQLAHHAFRGEVWDKAVSYLRRAGAKATARSAYREAVTCFEQALEALGHLPRNHDTMAQAVDLRLDLRTALTPLGHYREILGLLREAESLARELQDGRRLGHVIADMSARLRNTGDHAGALAAGRQACAIAAGLPDGDLRFEATYRLAQAHFAVGNFADSVDLLQQIIDVRRSGQIPPEVSRLPRYLAAWPRAWLALGLANLGHFTQAAVHGEEAIRIAESTAHPHSVIEARAALGRVHLAKGEFERAIALFETGLAPSRAWNIWDSSVLSGLGYAYALAGRVDEALPLLEEAVERGHSIDALGIGHAVRLSRLGEAYVLAGRLDEARERTREALDLARTQKERANEAYALRVLGDIASRGDLSESEAAQRCLREALTLAAELGMRPLVAHCQVGLGRLYQRTAKREQAREHFTAATTMYREMDMKFWLEHAETALRASG